MPDPITYNNRHLAQIKKLIDLLIPEYFAPSEAGDFVHYINNEIEDYYVIIENDHVIGCGGINYFPEQKTARLSWDMVHPNKQGLGIGSKLVEFRIDQIKAKAAYSTIVVRTSQHAEEFYQRFGFETIERVSDYWAKGMHLAHMKLDISKN